MNRSRWILLGKQEQVDSQSPIEDRRLQIRNLTRETTLASCLEVADTGAKRNKGLLGRMGLAPGEGLWILPCQSVHTFWMKFSIDLVYLDRKRRVRKVSGNVRPWRISVCLTAHSILELPAGTIAGTSTRPGDMLEILNLASQGTEGQYAAISEQHTTEIAR
jgi:uncharacterized protein